MFLPSADQYSFAIQHKAFSSLYFLNDHHFLRNGDTGEPSDWIFRQGQNAVIFKSECGGRLYAIRCFLAGEHETFRRYELLADLFSKQPLPWFASFDFLEKEIMIDGQQYPVLQMEWMEGQHFHDHLDEIVHDPSALTGMQEKLLAMSEDLEKNGIGHGDINLSHLMVVQENGERKLKLLDYDTMFIPAFNGLRSLGAGSPGFQHPARLASDFSPSIDRFSTWIFLAGLEALKTDPLLWENAAVMGYHKNQNLLFTYRDLLSPGQSRTFRKLQSLKNEALDFYLQKISSFCEAPGPEAVTLPELFRNGMHTSPARVNEKQTQPVEKIHEVEVKTIPSGRDVLVNGMKKGVTPLKLSIATRDLPHVEVLNGAQRTALEISEGVQTYEINFLKSSKKEQKEHIQSFQADHYRILEGELVTLHWKVGGSDPIYISGIGQVDERTGNRQLLLTHTTRYELSTGKEKRTITIVVDRKRISSRIAKTPPAPNEPNNIRRRKWLVPGILLVILGLSSLYYFKQLPPAKNAQASLPVKEAVVSLPPPSGIFVPATVRATLGQLYDAYNRRDLPTILSHYSNRLQEYYESGSVGRDSLGQIIRNLFIVPAFYYCVPDSASYQIKDEGTSCVVRVVLHETVQQDAKSRKENFNTPIEYRLNTNLKIVAEKTAQ